MASLVDSDDGQPRLSLVTEADDYSRSIGTVDIEVVRTGPGHTPTEILTSYKHDQVATAIRVGFPMLSRTTLADEVVAVMSVVAASPGTRVCGIEVTAKDVLVYGPGAEHLAVYPEGTRFAFTVISCEDLAEATAALGLDVEAKRGSVQRMVPSVASRRVGQILSAGDGDDPAALTGQCFLAGDDRFLWLRTTLCRPRRSSARCLGLPSRQPKATV